MTRSILCGLLALVSVGALGVLPVACQSGGVGDPCTPEDEYSNQFPGFKVSEENIESRSFQCSTRICLVNHFQGRVSCPQGQDGTALKSCNGTDDATTCAASGKTCTLSQTYAPACTVCDGTDMSCVPTACPSPLQCDASLGICTCTTADNGTSVDGVTYLCEHSAAGPLVLTSYVCHTPGACQTVKGGTTTDNDGPDGKTPLDCCIPGTDSPIAVSVCGQCESKSNRDAAHAVYCSCRCCVPCCTAANPVGDPTCSTDTSICGPACDPNFNYCDCPSGFTCTGIRTDVGLGDKELAGAYCIQQDTAYTNATDAALCGLVNGHWETGCAGEQGTPTAPDGGM
jgi:hypothetical protein